MVGHGTVWPRLARSWRVHGYRRLCDGLAVELLARQPVVWHPAGDARRLRGRHRDRLSVLSLSHYRTLLRAADPGIERHRAAGRYRGARCDRWIPRLHAGAL